MADFGLADPVDTAETLFDLVGIPGQVVVDHEVAALKVHTFAGCVVCNQHQHVAVLHEPLDDLAPLFPRHAAMDHIDRIRIRSEEHTSELQSLMRISYAVFCLKKKNKKQKN